MTGPTGPTGPWPSSAWDPSFAPPAEGRWRSPGYRSSRTRSRVAILAIAAVVAADLAGLLVAVRGARILDDFTAGAAAAPDADAVGWLLIVTGLAGSALYLVSVLGFLAWLTRMIDNIPPLTGHTPPRGPRQAIGWWFVPVACWIVPYQIIGDAVARLHAPEDGDLRWVRRTWWALLLAGNLLGTAMIGLDTGTVAGAHDSLVVSAVSDGLTVVTGLLLIIVVWALQSWSESRAAALALRPTVAAPAPTIASPAPTAPVPTPPDSDAPSAPASPPRPVWAPAPAAVDDIPAASSPDPGDGAP